MAVSITSDARHCINNLKIDQGNENYIKNWVESKVQGKGVYVVDVADDRKYLVTISVNGGMKYIDFIEIYKN
ncbi:hypothetical protein [Kistimonas asteriae]|uniref:hypothetical protein n=1 Tax=Kistimonas asteriae TaxID=517724 RepID=UPI001BA785B1|nr:hypothetical protein [Kistimonas asteriae]